MHAKFCLNSDPTLSVIYAESQRHARLENTLWDGVDIPGKNTEA